MVALWAGTRPAPTTLWLKHLANQEKSYAGEIVGHNSRDSTAIEAREKPLKKEPIQKIAAKRGRL